MHKEKKFRNVTQRIFFNHKHKKESIFWNFFLDVIFKNTSKVNVFDAFYR
jgi:hypothetical protein